METAEVLKVTEVAKSMRVHRQTVHNMIKDGRLKAFKFGNSYRIEKRTVDTFIHNTEKGGENAN